MFEFKKGDQNNLEGKVLVYVHNLKPHCENCSIYEYPGIYAATNKSDLLEYKNIDKEAIEMVDEAWKRAQEMLKELEKYKIRIVPMIFAPARFKSLEDINKINNGDIIFGGEINGLDFAIFSLYGLSTAYLANYMSQLESKAKINKTNFEDDKTFTDNYKNYKEKDLKLRLYAMTSELLHAIDSKENILEMIAVSNLRKFTQGADFSPDVINLIGVAQTNEHEKLNIISAYVDKIGAIYSERYEEAAEINKKIKILSEIVVDKDITT